MASLPSESLADLRAQAKITDGSIVLARQFVGTMTQPGLYLDRGKTKRVPASMAKVLWSAKPLTRDGAQDSISDFYWVNARQQFAHASGVLVKPEIAKGAANAASREASIRLLDISSRLDQGTIDVNEWYREVKTAGLALNTAEGMLGHGGFEQFGPEQRVQVEETVYRQWVGEEGKYPGLRSFADDVAAGRYGTPGEGMRRSFLQRVALHANAGNLTYENARILSHGEAGYTEGCRVRAAVNSCVTCIEEDGIWRLLEELIQIGDCECGSNCHCTIIFR